MYRNQIYRDATEALPDLFRLLDEEGEEVGSRNGRVKELTHLGITLREPWRRELLLPGRKPNLPAQIAETMWVLAGRDDIEWLSHYLPRAEQFSDDGRTWRGAYGPRLRGQLSHVLDLLRNNPLDRRAVITLYDPQVDAAPGKDIPCNNWLSFSSRLGKLDLHVAVRSNDAMWGWSGINAFEWSVLQEITAGLLGIEVGGLHFSVTSFHLYQQHWRKAQGITEAAGFPGSLEELPCIPFDATCVDRDLGKLDELVDHWFVVEKCIRNGDLDHKAMVDDFPEPMLQSWLRVLQWWWWAGGDDYLSPLKGTRMMWATRYSLHHGAPVAAPAEPAPSEFLTQLCALHLEKEAAYGGSWKRRGEMLGILANIARKVDRLGGETRDETSADTAGDLLVYLAKYRTWLSDAGAPGGASDDPACANEVMHEVERQRWSGMWPVSVLEERLGRRFNRLEIAVQHEGCDRFELVDEMMGDAYQLARTLWNQESHAMCELGGPCVSDDCWTTETKTSIGAAR